MNGKRDQCRTRRDTSGPYKCSNIVMLNAQAACSTTSWHHQILPMFFAIGNVVRLYNKLWRNLTILLLTKIVGKIQRLCESACRADSHLYITILPHLYSRGGPCGRPWFLFTDNIYGGIKIWKGH